MLNWFCCDLCGFLGLRCFGFVVLWDSVLFLVCLFAIACFVVALWLFSILVCVFV